MRTFLCAGLAWFVAAAGILGAEIKLKNGAVYHNADILRQTGFDIEMQLESGTMIRLPASAVDSIDGKRISTLPMPRLAMAKHPATPPVIEALPPGYVHNWTIDYFLVAFAVVAALWVWMLIWVQQNVRGTPGEIRRANADVLLLPVLGFMLYLVARARRERKRREPRTLTGRVAALRPDEAPKKRSLFSGRAKMLMRVLPRKQRVSLEFLDVDRNPIQIRKDSPEMTGIEAARDILEDAIAERASDVHVEPGETGCRVRFRVDGVLQERVKMEKADGLRMLSSLKTLAQIDVAEKRRAQDGRFRVRVGDAELDFRVATASAIHGEKMVLRILDRKSGVLGLTELGMPAEMLQQFDRVIHSRNGIILATGPTGSGKTSTLYAALSRLDAKRLNIMSIEDPVEYELAGATQIPVNARAGVTYEAGLRSILRQDPDVIFVGEMRDAEAAKIAIRAALTGHLVFSTLHTKDAPSTVVRLEEIGVERYQISTALLLVVAQRLVRVLCKACRERYQSAGNELAELSITIPAGKLIYRAKGCEACDGTGFQGRTGIFEMMVMDEELRTAVNEGAPHQRLQELATRKGYRSYREDGAEKVMRGFTSVEEVLRAS
jgi:general secretion pathway protein E